MFRRTPLFTSNRRRNIDDQTIAARRSLDFRIDSNNAQEKGNDGKSTFTRNLSTSSGSGSGGSPDTKRLKYKWLKRMFDFT